MLKGILNKGFVKYSLGLAILILCVFSLIMYVRPTSGKISDTGLMTGNGDNGKHNGIEVLDFYENGIEPQAPPQNNNDNENSGSDSGSSSGSYGSFASSFGGSSGGGETVQSTIEITKVIEGPYYGQCPPNAPTDVCYLDGVTNIIVNTNDPDPTGTCEWGYYLDDNYQQFFGWYATFPVHFPEETKHELRIRCWDALGNPMPEDVEVFYVDKTPPTTTKTYGQPLVETPTGGYPKWITSQTPIMLTVDDTGPHKSGIKETMYRITLMQGNESCLSNDVCQQQQTGGGVDLGTAGNFAILSKSGITNVPTSAITGDVGTSPITGAAITGLECPEVNGTIYTVDDAGPSCKVIDPVLLTAAVSDMGAAYTNLSGRTPDYTELGAGNIGGMTLAPGVYKWSTDVTIPTDVTLSGGPNDVWIFQIAGTLSISSDKKVILSGDAQAKNIFWVVAGTTTLGTTSVFNGNILGGSGASTIALLNGATLNGRALAQKDVTLIANTVSLPPVGGQFNIYLSPFQIQQESCHMIEYYSVDNVNKTEIIKRQCVFVDNTLTSYCGDGAVNAGEQCELPNTYNNTYCIQNTSQCQPSGRKLGTRDAYGNCDGSCGCTNDPFVYNCVKDVCGAECDLNSGCPDYCDGSVKHTGRTCGWCSTCLCTNGTAFNCNSLDAWYNTTETKWVSTGECTEKEQKKQEYRDYNCGTSPAVDCYYNVTQTNWVDTGQNRNKPDGTSCNDGFWCRDNDVCTAGVCNGATKNCSQYNIPMVARCDNVPDANSYTWDYGAGFVSVCDEEHDRCTTGEQNLTHTCSVLNCSAQCDATHGCANSTCSQTYNDYCNTTKLVEYDSDKVKDSTTVNGSCQNSCRSNCTCTNCTASCSPPPTNTYCVKGVCDASCAVNSDCTCQQDGCVGKDYYDYPSQGACTNGCSCDQGSCTPSISYNDPRCSHKVCDYQLQACSLVEGAGTNQCSTWQDCQFCGNGVVDGFEQCELPSTVNNAYCIQTTSQCSGTKLGTRDALGNCGASCGCVYDPFTYACVKGQCGATCTVNGDCSASTCSQTYNDYCTGNKLTEYDSDKVQDSTTVTNSTSNTCQGSCLCTNNAVTCNPPSTNMYCVKGVCSAACAVNSDCDDGNVHTTDTCDVSNCICKHELIPYCGDGNVNAGEQCELPSTVNNAYCIQTTSQCSGTKLGTRDALGNCGASCGCVYDPFTYACVKGQCGAACAVNSDCTCQQDGCVGTDYYDYPDHTTCDGNCACGECNPVITECDPRCMGQCKVEVKTGHDMSPQWGYPYTATDDIWIMATDVSNGACNGLTMSVMYAKCSCPDWVPEQIAIEATRADWYAKYDRLCTADASSVTESLACGECHLEMYHPRFPEDNNKKFWTNAGSCHGTFQIDLFITRQSCFTLSYAVALGCAGQCEDHPVHNECNNQACVEVSGFGSDQCTTWNDCQFCGNGRIDGNEQCELPNTLNNAYCIQTTSQCSGTKLGTRDALGNCGASCGCVYDPFTYACVKGQCGAACAVNSDCTCQQDGCVGKDYYDYPSQGACTNGCTCDQGACTPAISCNDPRCSHKVCDYQLQACSLVEGAGTNECNSNDDCYYSACDYNQNACVKKDGTQTDQCSTWSDCIRKVCNYQTLTCDVVESLGTSECSSFSDCTEYHYECTNWYMCEAVPGPGTNECNPAKSTACGMDPRDPLPLV